MSATVQMPSHSWASAHRALLTLLALTVALAVAVAVSLVVSRAATDDPVAPPALADVQLVPDGCLHALPGTAC